MLVHGSASKSVQRPTKNSQLTRGYERQRYELVVAHAQLHGLQHSELLARQIPQHRHVKLAHRDTCVNGRENRIILRVAKNFGVPRPSSRSIGTIYYRRGMYTTGARRWRTGWWGPWRCQGAATLVPRVRRSCIGRQAAHRPRQMSACRSARSSHTPNALWERGVEHLKAKGAIELRRLMQSSLSHLNASMASDPRS